MIAALLLCAAALPPENAPPCPAAAIVYGQGDSARCFSTAFLELAAAHTPIAVPERLAAAPLAASDLLDYPFCLLSGEGGFRLDAAEKQHLRSYLRGGGFVLASAGCSSAAWDASFRETLAELVPEAALEPLPEEHPVFTFLFPCARPVLGNGEVAVLHALVIEGRVACIYSPAGLNDTAALPDCCCCTGHEIENARHLAANIFLYALLGGEG
ncbi:MAG TPA: DUF4159 domain-containing protein [Planctomycetota bacterium]|jgi:hypothetical protein|nr:DUF4159 domain-containing protein [Planctomycetota bacterium]OQC20853.1 MAG: hypothetical protein BWX69_01481 [Planctomycetes bacterium ADurb.Bin069]HNR99625.1 DUF4159 domain-containing protein [Planctomycetota bacterium]HNU25632.1 DUF4159 domain-containing protein [Planctomycetota bacterium]HOE29993.1 DUF4159 domain-containing protein [Planctomycetota bacterium]